MTYGHRFGIVGFTSSTAEQRVPTGADEAAEHDEHDAENHLALQELHDPDDYEYCGDDPKDGCVHVTQPARTVFK